MKNTTLILLLILPLSLSAQFQLQNRLSFGPRAGLNIANIDRENSSAITGLLVGLTTTYSLNESSGITVDVLYSGEGYELNGVKTQLDLIRIPVLYDLFFGKLGEDFRPKLYSGAAPGILLNARDNGREVKEDYESLVLDLVLGGGFNYRLMNRVWLNADARLGIGLNSFKQNIEDHKNLNIQLSLGVAYGI